MMENIKVHNASCLSLKGFRELEAFFEKVGWNPTYVEDGFDDVDEEDDDIEEGYDEYDYLCPSAKWMVEHEGIINAILMIFIIAAFAYISWICRDFLFK